MSEISTDSLDNLNDKNSINNVDNADKKINANPTKRFFIDMLVRDIDLEPAIVELVDNSLDGAKRIRKEKQYEGTCEIKVSLEDDQFEIADTCGGISIYDAKHYCFRFGRDAGRPFDLVDGTGVFGIGMKRALFRLGKEFDIESTTLTEHFKIHIDVDTWLDNKNPDWTFEFSDIGSNENNDITTCGTVIRVRRLHEGIKNSFKDPLFISRFYDYIQRRSAIIKSLGVNVIVNNKNVQYADEMILFSNMFKPFVKKLEIDDVKIKIIAGCAKMGEPKKAGWYVQCNGRTVLYANRDEETGWGIDGVRNYHAAFASFRGYVEFESKYLEKLPWNTTKTGVDRSSKYYQLALTTMKECTKIFISWRDKVDEFINDNEETGIQVKDIFLGREVGILSHDIAQYSEKDSQFIFPSLDSKNYPAPPEPVTRISITLPKVKVETIKDYYGNSRMTNKEVGERIFKYFYEREID